MQFIYQVTGWNIICSLHSNMPSIKNHICLAEDDPDDYFIFSHTLGEINKSIKLSWFTTCEDLLEYLKRGNELPDIIVLDMNMPKMDGQTCLTTIKKEANLLHIPVAILSTGNNPTSIQAAHDGGAIKYFVKPHSLTDFKNIVLEILNI